MLSSSVTFLHRACSTFPSLPIQHHQAMSHCIAYIMNVCNSVDLVDSYEIFAKEAVSYFEKRETGIQ